MALVSNPGFLAVAFIEGSAAFILLVLYASLAPGFSARFFRVWLVGWAMYAGLETLRISSLWRGGPDTPPFGPTISLFVAGVFLAAILACTGREKKLRYLWPLGVIVASGLVALNSIVKLPLPARWGESLAESLLYLVAGWILWRSRSQHHGFGWKLLAGVLLLRGLHGLDRPEWGVETLGLLRVSFQGLFGIAMGIAMAVLVLEAGRARTEDLNERLRRLALVTAEATQSFRVRETLEGVLCHLVESLNASHGFVFLFDGPEDSAHLVIRASVGFSERFLKQYAKVSPGEPWLQRLLDQETRFVSCSAAVDPSARRWMEAENVAAIVLVRVPGKERPIGLLGIGSSVPRAFESDEEHFLVNVANLLGLTIQNVALFESAATSKRQWLDTFDSIHDLILVHSPDGRILRANRSLAWHLGVEPDLIEGQHLRELLRQGSAPWSVCPYCEGAAGKEEGTDPTFGGHFIVTNSTFHDSEGARLGVIHVLKDFTERRLAESKFRTLFEKVQEGIFISTPEGRFLDFNDAFLRILGYERREELLQADIPQIYVNPADRVRLKRLLHESDEVTDFEFQFRRGDGEIRTARESSFVTRDDAGVVVAYQGFLLDITERKTAEMEIRRRNRELLALNAIGEVLSKSSSLEEALTRALAKVTELFTMDVGAVYLLDEPARTLKRVAAVGLQSEYARHFSPVEVEADLLQQVRKTHATVLSGSIPALPEAFRQVHQRECIEVSQVVVLWAKDRIMGVLTIGSRTMHEFSPAELSVLAAAGNQIATAIDKSLLLEETREAYISLRRTQEQLLQSEKMAAVGQLVSGVAHELNNPLTAILGYTQLLKTEEFTGPRIADFVVKISKQAQRTHQIVQNLLSFARQHKPQRAPVDLNQIIEEALILREYDMSVGNLRIHREFDSQLPPVGGDFHQLQQVFLNILNNAVDAIREKGEPGEIWIRTEVRGQRARVEFTDNGPGVQNLHRVFDPFYTTKPIGKGTGLGLSICYGIIKEHGGEIEVRNSPPLGATFAITLPVLSDLHASETEDPTREKDVVAGQVLLVGDEETVLHLEREILVGRGVSVRAARSANEAISVLQRDTFDAVVVDRQLLGEVSTRELYQWIEQNRPELVARLIFTASDTHDGEFSAAMRKAGYLFVSQPFGREEFWRVVQTALRSDTRNPVKR